MPVVAIVERHVDLRLAAREQQPLLLGVFLDGIDRGAVGQPGGDLRPALAAVAGAIDMRTKVVEPDGVHRGVRSERITVRRVDDRDLRPRCNFRWRDILPGETTVSGG